jgi:transcription elongation factor GreA
MKQKITARLEVELARLTDELTVHIPARLGTEQNHRHYQDTLDVQKLVRTKASQLRRLLNGLEGVSSAALLPDRAGFGSHVRVEDLDTGETVAYTIMDGDGIDLDSDEVSVHSPVGQALVGRAPGAVVEVTMPHRTRRLRVISVATLFERFALDPEPVTAV